MIEEFEPERPPRNDSRRTLGRAPIYRQPQPEDDWPDDPPRKTGRLAKAGYAMFVLALTVSLVWVLERSVEQTMPSDEGPKAAASGEYGAPPDSEAEPALTIPTLDELVASDRSEAAMPVDARSSRDEQAEGASGDSSSVDRPAPNLRANASAGAAAREAPAPRPEAAPRRVTPPLSARSAQPATPPPSSSRVAGLRPPPARPPSSESTSANTAALTAPPTRSTTTEPGTPPPPLVKPPASPPRATAEPTTAAPPPAVETPAAVPRVAIEEPTLIPPVTPPADPVPPPAPDTRAAAPAPPPAAAAASAAAGIEGERNAIRDVLGRYRSAYNALDANAARQVWPTVNERSLEKAFEQLEQQRVAFENCAINVKGVLAEADCRGSTRFVPRVGSGSEQVVSRRWNFTLRKAYSGGWVIYGVDVR